MNASAQPGVMQERRMIWLAWLLVANIIASVVHYADNLMFFEEYPEPPWINRTMIDAFWFAMTPLAWLGHHLIERGVRVGGCLVLVVYAGCNMLSLGHYNYASICSIGFRINAFILLEATLAALLLAYLVVMLCAAGSGRAGTRG